MCRSLAESGRRCPCSLPNRRSAADRARYAAKKASLLTVVKPNLGSAPLALARPAVPTVEQVREAANLAGLLYDDMTPRADLDPQMLARLSEFTDSREALVRQVGSQLAARAEFHAGITSDEVHEAWVQRSADTLAQYERLKADDEAKEVELGLNELRQKRDDTTTAWALSSVNKADPATVEQLLLERDNAEKTYWAAFREYRDYHDGIRKALQDARIAHINVETGTDAVSREHLQRLSDGYSKALAEVRGTGGSLQWNGKSVKKARDLFDRAVQVYPSDWIEASNRRAAPIAKTSTGRAHYADAKIHESKKRMPVTVTEITSKDFQPPEDESRTYYDLRYGYVPKAGTRPDLSGQVGWTRTSYEVYSEWKHRTRDGKPVGTGWAKVSYRDNTGAIRETWRRPQTRMTVVATEAAPELTVSDRTGPLGGPGYEVAVHELAHRMEATVPMISRMESEFLARRTTTNGVRDKRVVYLQSGRNVELTRPDDFVDTYMGKEYNSGVYHEVMSTGTQGMFGGSFGGLVGVGKYKKDDDMRAFVLGVMASARPVMRNGR